MSEKAETLIGELLKILGENPAREGLRGTPARAWSALKELTSGYGTDLDRIINGAFFNVNYGEMVIVKDIDFHSLCEHHILPFFGKVHIAYVPSGKILGLSKFPRLVNAFSRRLQVQERLTVEIASFLYEKLKPKGIGVIIEARHLCMTMRGVKNATSKAVTSSMLGCFEKDPKTREEFLMLIKRSGSGNGWL